MKSQSLLLAGVLVQANSISSVALPLGGSIIAYELMLKLYFSHLQNKPITIKALFSSIPYSDMGIRYHLNKLVENGWIQLEFSEVDRRTKICMPTEKLIFAWDGVIGQISAWLEVQIVEDNSMDLKNIFPSLPK